MKNQINKSINDKGKVTTDNTERERIIREYNEQLYGNKIDNLGKNGQILRKVQSSKTELRRNRNYEQSNYKH